MSIHGEAFDLYARNTLECIRSLWQDPEFVNDLILEPERQYADSERGNRMYHDMHTGDWWWDTQVSSSHHCSFIPSSLVNAIEKG